MLKKYALPFILGVILVLATPVIFWSIWEYRSGYDLSWGIAATMASANEIEEESAEELYLKEDDTVAIYLLDQISKKNPNRPEAFFWLGSIYKDNECYSLAITNFTKAAQVNEKIGSHNFYVYENHFEIAEVYERLKDHSSAEKHYLNSINLLPNHPAPYWRLAHLYLLQGDQKKAKEYFRLFIEHESREDEKADEIIKAKDFLSN